MDPLTQSRVLSALAQQEHKCGSCGGDFDSLAKTMLLQVVTPHIFQDESSGEWKLHFEKQVREDGDFEQAPYFFHEGCWLEASESLKEEVENNPPTRLEGESIACHCSFCGSDVADGDTLGIVHYGDFILSNRQPNRQDALEHTMEGGPQYLCTECLFELNTSVLEGLWSDSNDGEENEVTENGRRD